MSTLDKVYILQEHTRNIQYVLHASDIHIRTGDLEKSRYQEYEQVFQTFIHSIANHPHLDQAVLLLTGDIFHHKGKIEPAGIKLAQRLLTQLLEHVDVCFICGNHDYRQDNPEIPDLLETIFQNYFQHKVHTKYKTYYLRHTGYYLYHNVGFTVVDIRDTLNQFSTSGRKSQLECFPTKDMYKEYPFVQYPVAVFHGTILPSRLMNHMTAPNGYELSWFGNYEYIMLGDNHRVQWTQEPSGPLWGYPGSLIQQDFGENFLEHGYLLWNLAAKTVSFHSLFNNYGYCTVKEGNQRLYAHLKHRTWVELETIQPFPSHVSFRVFSKDVIPKLESFCKAHKIHPTCILQWSHSVEDSSAEEKDKVEDKLQQMEELNTPEKWFEYLEKYTDVSKIREYILHPELLKLPPLEKPFDFPKKYTDRNDKIQKVIDEYVDESHKIHKNVPRVELVHMSWAYLMCYGANNHFHFESLKNKIALLNGKNAMGKSSFLDVLCIALYGEPTKMRHLVTGRKYTDKIIHDQRPANKTAPFVRLMFRIGTEYFEIYRSFGIQAAKNKEHLILQTNIQIYKIANGFDDPYKTLLYEGSILVDKWIEENIGSMESVLMSTMICQVDLNNFFHLKQEEQKQILDKALRLDTVSLYGRILKESILAHQDILQQVRTTQQTLQKVLPETIYSYEDVLSRVQVLEKNYHEQLQQKQIFTSKISKYIPKDRIPENIQTLFYEVETDFLEKGISFTPEEQKEYIVYQEKLAQIQKAYEPIQDAPIIPDDERLYTKWQKKYESFLKKEPTCPVRKEWIHENISAYETWKKENEEMLSMDIATVELAYQTAEKAFLQFSKIEAPNVPEPEAETKKQPIPRESEQNYPTWKQQYQYLLSHPYEKRRTLQEYTSWKKEYEEWYRSIQSVISLSPEKIEKELATLQKKRDTYMEKESERLEQEQELERLQKEVDDLQTFSFNPDCWACQKNPYNKKKQNLLEQQTELVSYYQQLVAYLQKITKSDLVLKWNQQIQELENALFLWKKYETNKDSYFQQQKEWEQIHKEWKEYELWREELKTLQENIQTYEAYQSLQLWKRYRKQEKEHQTLLQTYSSAKKVYESVKKVHLEYQRWCTVLQEIESYKEIYQLYEIWEEEHTILKTRLESYQRSIEKRRLETLQQEYEKIYLQRKDAMERYQEYEETKNMYFSYKLYTLEDELSRIREERDTVLSEKAKAEASYEMKKQQEASFTQLQKVESLLEERLQQIRELDLLFMGDKTNSDGYKEWIYRYQVIPLLNKEMNTFLKMFEHFTFEMVYDKKNFIYMIEDRGNKPTLDKASGYQNFIVALALRIIFTRIGAVGQQLKHLFMDEGFTACDSVNIEKVPLLLQSILTYGDYHSILMMSHLDSVRECTNLHVEIERKDPFSSIQFGIPYPDLCVFQDESGKLIPKKGRGRPKKV